MKRFCTLLASALLLPCTAANVPVEWTADVGSLAIHEISARRGETLDLAVTLKYNGGPFTPEGDWEIFYQTNGMLSAYFTFPVSISGNVARIVFTPAMDPGADRLTGFIGCRGVNYRAAFALRFYGSPGAAPNSIPLPVQTLDFAAVAWTNAPWATVADLAAKRDKADMAVYKTSDLTFPLLPDDCWPVSFVDPLGVVYVEKSGSGFKEYDMERISFNGALGPYVFFDMQGVFKSAVYDNTTFNGHPGVPGVWPKLIMTETVTADRLATIGEVATVESKIITAPAVTNIARAVVNTVWDDKLGVAWEARMHDGALYYVAVTNRQEVAE